MKKIARLFDRYLGTCCTFTGVVVIVVVIKVLSKIDHPPFTLFDAGLSLLGLAVLLFSLFALIYRLDLPEKVVEKAQSLILRNGIPPELRNRLNHLIRETEEKDDSDKLLAAMRNLEEYLSLNPMLYGLETEDIKTWWRANGIEAADCDCLDELPLPKDDDFQKTYEEIVDKLARLRQQILNP
ncbi:MAG: hypothetical protein WC285_06375 [Candidatus Gracilibacteria bacterium]|jgi:hypothetical protein